RHSLRHLLRGGHGRRRTPGRGAGHAEPHHSGDPARFRRALPVDHAVQRPVHRAGTGTLIPASVPAAAGTDFPCPCFRPPRRLAILSTLTGYRCSTCQTPPPTLPAVCWTLSMTTARLSAS